MELDEALGRISDIRAQIARTQTFRGFRSATVGFSGLLGIAAAVFQSLWIPDPLAMPWMYVDLWAAVAIVSILVVAAEQTYRCRLENSPLKTHLTLLMVRQFVPCLFAGGVLTYVLPTFAPEAVWMLPGLWAILFSQGIFATCRLLPQEVFWVGVYYLVTGTFCVAWGSQTLLAPWMMAVTFGGGQLLSAAILYYTLERTHVTGK